WADDGGPAVRLSDAAEAELAEWARIDAELTARFPVLGDRDDCLVATRRPTRSGAPGAFFRTEHEVEIDRKLFGGLDPATIRPAIFGDEDRYPAAWGVLCHEGAHAAFTRWDEDTTLTERLSAACAVAMMLEDSRAEKRHLTRRPGDARYLRSAATTLILDDLGTTPPDSPWSAASAAALVLARRDAGILEPAETAELEQEVAAILGEQTLATLAEIWNVAHDTEDQDAETMLALGRAWCEAMGLEAAEPEPHEESVTSGGAIAGAIGRTGANIAATEAARAAAEQQEEDENEDQAAERIKAKKAKASRRRRAEDTAEAVFAPNAGPFQPGGNSGMGIVRPSPVIGSRLPTKTEKAAAGQLARALRAAAYRERVETVTASAAPPGRLHMRAAMARDAQRAAGATPTALPWTHTTRRATPTPPLRVGIAVDVSGSMSAATRPIASAAWILAKAAAMTDRDSRTATVAFDECLTAITRPGRAPAHVTRFEASGGGHALGDAIDALDVALQLSQPGAGRLLVIASDLHYMPHETDAAVERVNALKWAGCAVLHLDFDGYGSATYPGATRLEVTNPATAASAIAKAATAAITASR
ncbi:VWA domain-containing protein, partial [Catenulispora rubra]|uniref:VWA domain-containing protein n=1 Tax=Catenulispora rubra TaxID=280293 RepID=UPI0018924DC7